jgi:hypothetical protein
MLDPFSGSVAHAFKERLTLLAVHSTAVRDRPEGNSRGRGSHAKFRETMMVLVLLGLDRGYCLRVSVGYEIECPRGTAFNS